MIYTSYTDVTEIRLQYLIFEWLQQITQYTSNYNLPPHPIFTFLL